MKINGGSFDSVFQVGTPSTFKKQAWLFLILKWSNTLLSNEMYIKATLNLQI